MTDVSILRTGCKLNLFLHISGIRANGYHELCTLFLPLPEPWDELRLRPLSEEGLSFSCAEAWVNPVDNTLTKAYELYAAASGYRPGLELKLSKGIPSGAGLGGGSADAALLLNWLQSVNPSPLGEDALGDLALRVGADVPFFLNPQPCLGTGLGEKLQPLDKNLDEFYLVLLCPEIRVNTPAAYAAWDRELANGALTLYAKTDKNHCSCPHGMLWLENSFEPVVFSAHPELLRLKARLLQEGAAGAGMSGSGSSLFGLFREETTAIQAVNRLGSEGAAVYGPMRTGTYAPPEQPYVGV